MPPITPDDATELQPPREMAAPPAEVHSAPGSIWRGTARVGAYGFRNTLAGKPLFGSLAMEDRAVA